VPWPRRVATAAYLFVVNPALSFVRDRAMGQGEAVGHYFRFYWDDVAFGVAWRRPCQR
jgi:hypothetical protein